MKDYYYIHATWEMSGTYEIEADNLREAIQMAKNKALPENSTYVEDSYSVDDIDSIYEANGIEIPSLSAERIRAELDKRTDSDMDSVDYFDPETADYSVDDLAGILRDYYDEEYVFD